MPMLPVLPTFPILPGTQAGTNPSAFGPTQPAHPPGGVVQTHTFVAGGGDDFIVGTPGSDNILAGGGNDTVDAGAGFDFIDGGGGDDRLSAGAAGGNLFGGSGNDVLDGGTGGLSILHGDAGDDTLIGGTGQNQFIGGPGHDLLVGGSGGNLFEVPIDPDDTDTVVPGSGTNELSFVGRAQSTFVYTLPDGFDDLFVTHLLGAGANLTGNAADNVILGSEQNDTLRGGGGNDTMDGGRGVDTLFGQGGDDLFVFTSGDAGTDRIADFERGLDRVELKGYAPTDLVAQTAAFDPAAQTYVHTLSFVDGSSISAVDHDAAGLTLGKDYFFA